MMMEQLESRSLFNITIELTTPTQITVRDSEHPNPTLQADLHPVNDPNGPGVDVIFTLHPYETGLNNTFQIRNNETEVSLPPSGTVIINFHLNDLIEIKMEDHFHWFINTTNGDLNHDGHVTISDFIDLASNFNEEGQWYDGDLNHDGVITISDMIDLAANME